MSLDCLSKYKNSFFICFYFYSIKTKNCEENYKNKNKIQNDLNFYTTL